MSSSIDLTHCTVDGLRPTQVCVGMVEVREKIRRFAHLGNDERKAFLKARPLPCIVGPEGALYPIDHHHLARAVYDTGHSKLYARVVEDRSHLSISKFWASMIHSNLVYLSDQTGKKIAVDSLPARIGEMADDPWRSLAGEVRRLGGFIKDPTPYSEFKWADFFRARVSVGVGEEGFAEALKQAMKLAASPTAKKLPGFVGQAS